jgi:uncharacterized protein (DUF3084 family)
MSLRKSGQDETVKTDDEHVDVLKSGHELGITIERIGGIIKDSRSFNPGIVPLVGENATNRTSFLMGIMAGLGSRRDDFIAANTGTNKNEGRVELNVGRKTFSRNVKTAPSGETVLTGDPVVSDPNTAELLDLYAFLHGENEVRQTIETNGDIYDILMRPVDTEEIKQKRRDKNKRKAELDEEIQAIKESKDELTRIEEDIKTKTKRKESLQTKIEQLSEKLEACKQERRGLREKMQTEISDERERAEDKIEELENKKEKLNAEIDDVKNERLNTENSIQELEERYESHLEKLQSVKAEADTKLTEIEHLDAPTVELSKEADDYTDRLLDAYTSSISEAIAKLENDIETKEQETDRIETQFNSLREERDRIQSLIELVDQVNDHELDLTESIVGQLHNEVLSGPITISEDTISPQSHPNSSDDSVTDALLSGNNDTNDSTHSGQCLVCGQSADTSRLEDVKQQYDAILEVITGEIDNLGNRREKLHTSISSDENRIQELDRLISRLKTQKKELEELETKAESYKNDLEGYDDRIETKQRAINEIEEELDTITLNELSESDAQMEAYQDEIEQIENRQSSLETDLHDRKSEKIRVERQLEELKNKREHLEKKVGREEEKRDELNRIEQEISELLGLVQTKEEALVEQFNDHMEAVIDGLGFANIERVWIEHKKTDDGGDTLSKTADFEVHIVRQRESGAAYECKLKHLSESERNVIGLMFALTGYLVHDVADVCPVVILDSIEMIDAERAAGFLTLLKDVIDAKWIFTALLPEHVNENTKPVVGDFEEFTSQTEIVIE